MHITQSVSQIFQKIVFCSVAVFLFALPVSAHAALDVAGWIPWWIDDDAVEDVENHLRDLDTIYPFVYEVQNDGTLKDRANLGKGAWKDLLRRAERKDVEIIPTVAWFDGESIHRILSDDDLREEHIEEIVGMVEEGGFDGVDVDYEQKLAETIDYFSEFLKELEDELGRKILTCTIEARTPPSSIYRTVPNTIQYANDYDAMDRYCDRVEIMAYDQQRVDWRLNSEKRGEPYIPVADVDWVEKVLKLALKDIDEDKIILGIPTYGREWELIVEPEWYKEYDNIQAVNMPDAEKIADRYDVRPGRNKAGELSFSYFPKESIYKVLNALPTPEGTRRGFEAAAKALLFADATGQTVPVNVVWYSDARAVEDKVDLADKYDLRGVSIFKIDGEEDKDIWDLF